MITYFSFEPNHNLFTDLKGRTVISGEVVFSTNKIPSIRTRLSYAVATKNGWVLMNKNDYGVDVNSLIQNELNSVCPQVIASF